MFHKHSIIEKFFYKALQQQTKTERYQGLQVPHNVMKCHSTSAGWQLRKNYRVPHYWISVLIPNKKRYFSEGNIQIGLQLAIHLVLTKSKCWHASFFQHRSPLRPSKKSGNSDVNHNICGFLKPQASQHSFYKSPGWIPEACAWQTILFKCSTAERFIFVMYVNMVLYWHGPELRNESWNHKNLL